MRETNAAAAGSGTVREGLTCRALVYFTIARLFRYPELDTLRCLTDEKRLEELQFCLPRECSLNACRRAVSEWLDIVPDAAVALRELEVEYTRLFINAFPTVVAPPYGSLYLEPDAGVWGATTHAVLGLYREAGLGMATSGRAIPDHIVAELEFAACLAQDDMPGNESAPTEDLWFRFASEFFLPWVPEFMDRVAKQTKSVFYREVAGLARDFVHWDTENSRTRV